MRRSWSIPFAMMVAGTASAVAMGAVGDDVIKPESVKLAAAGQTALDNKQPSAAIDAFEAALAADPKNANAFLGIAHAYEAQGLPGRAIKYYREALVIEPNDLGALEGQGRALVARGATTRAQVNLDRIKALCKTDCPAAKRLEVALAAPPPVAPVTPVASAEPAKPVVAKN